MDKETAKVAKSFVEEVRSAIDLKKVILFGSRSRGDNFETSDYDVLLVSNDFGGLRMQQRMAKVYEYWDDKRDLEPLCYTEEEFERKSKELGIVSRALKEGKILYSS